MARMLQIIFTVLLPAAINPLTSRTVPNMQINSNIHLHHLLLVLLTSTLPNLSATLAASPHWIIITNAATTIYYMLMISLEIIFFTHHRFTIKNFIDRCPTFRTLVWLLFCFKSLFHNLILYQANLVICCIVLSVLCPILLLS